MRDELTELEHCVLGIVWRDGPMTAYEVASRFAVSLSPYWSGSAGAIYPLVKRLQKRGLILAELRAWNGSRKAMLSTTGNGEKALRSWLEPPLPDDAGAPSFDPVRTRIFFLDILPVARREAFLDEAERVIAGQLQHVVEQRSAEEARGDELEALGSLGVIFELKARKRWLRAVREHLKKTKPRRAVT
jgi:DNA-binding PadR family transcriptional regulator